MRLRAPASYKVLDRKLPTGIRRSDEWGPAVNKVMTRTRRTPGTRPPVRQDTRRPGGAGPSTARNGALPGTARPDGPPAAAGGGAAPRTARDAAGLRPTDLFAERLVEVLSGRRPVHCMLRHTVGRAYDELAWLAERGPLRTRGTRPVVRDVGYYVPRPGAVEAFARIGAGDQLRAMAFRLEQGPDLRWRCTAVELGGPRMPRPTDD